MAARSGSVATWGVCIRTVLFCTAIQAFAPVFAWAQASAQNPWDVTIVLPPRIIAGQPATLAVLGPDGKLAPDVNVDIGAGQHVKTDDSGRAFFTAPANASFLIAKTLASSAASLVDTALPGRADGELAVAPFASLSDRFAICGVGFRGDADANRVTLDGRAALVLASSPECLVVLAGPRATTGEAKIAIDAAGKHWEGTTALVSVRFEAPQPPIEPQKRSRLTLVAEGTKQKLEITVENQTPGVLRFLHSDKQNVRTSGGSPNSAAIEIEAIRSGDFSFHAQLAAPADTASAERYLRAALTLASKDYQRAVRGMAERLKGRPRDASKVRAQLDQVLAGVTAGDFRTLLEAARVAL